MFVTDLKEGINGTEILRLTTVTQVAVCKGLL